MRKAVIDVGSNSVLLVISEFTGEKWTQLYEDTSVTALGEGTKATGLLGEAGMSSTLRALASFYAKAHQFGVETIQAAATMAARIATNTTDFLERANDQKTPVFVLSGEDEAELGFISVATDPIFSNESRISIIDPGGHSTELVTADRANNDWAIRFRRSYPIGTLGMRTTYFPSERIEPMAMLKGIASMDDLIGLCYRPNQSGAAVVLGASGTNLISIREKLEKWDPERVHGARLDYEEISKAFGWLAPMSDSERAAVPGLEPGREKTIHLGALILERFLFALRTGECRVSVRGWRHALLERGLPGSS